MGAMFSSPSYPTPTPPPATPTAEDPAVEDARRKEILASKAKGGKALSLLTGGLGVSEGTTPVRKTSLLGVS